MGFKGGNCSIDGLFQGHLPSFTMGFKGASSSIDHGSIPQSFCNLLLEDRGSPLELLVYAPCLTSINTQSVATLLARRTNLSDSVQQSMQSQALFCTSIMFTAPLREST